jgi:3-hydroxybutyrate dehydrogenase
MSEFKGKVALITGAASGIRKEVAVRFAAAGGIPIIADLNDDAAKAVATELGAEKGQSFAVGMDVTDESSVEDAVSQTYARFKRIDVLVSNAGIQIVKPLVEFSLAEWKKMLAIHWRWCTEAVTWRRFCRYD